MAARGSGGRRGRRRCGRGRKGAEAGGGGVDDGRRGEGAQAEGGGVDDATRQRRPEGDAVDRRGRSEGAAAGGAAEAGQRPREGEQAAGPQEEWKCG